ncbi:MAG: chemotaxis protein CheW [Bdellovibrionales bacterium]|nr:chemotaxis protein CheW [Bdellovibrionales bacterium]
MSKTEKYLCYYLGQELFASPLAKVVEIYQLQDIEPLKLSKSIFLGKFSAGAIDIPLFDLSKIMGRSSKKDRSEESCIVIFDLSDGPWGALVDSLEGITTFSSNDIQIYSEADSPIYAKASGINRTYKFIDPEKMIKKIDRLRFGHTPVQKVS